jgi:hypothetical protein
VDIDAGSFLVLNRLDGQAWPTDGQIFEPGSPAFLPTPVASSAGRMA